MEKRAAGERRGITYAEAGVDVVAKDAAAKSMVAAVNFARTGLGAPLGGAGHFAGMVEFGEYALVLCTDGVGTKLEIANSMRKWDTVGIDCVAMNVNDAICVGAEPLAFVDYLAVDRADPDLSRELGKGLDEGCRLANVSLVGGETAILPDLVKGFDLAGTCLAFVRRDRIVTGDAIQPGDAIVGVASAGIHSNGYTLVRRVLAEAGVSYQEPFEGRPLGEVLLEPTRIYVRAALDLLASGVEVRGIAHVTGSGLLNLPRLKKGLRYVLDRPLDPPPIFGYVQELGGIAASEMYRTFNMGMGLAVVVPPGQAAAAAQRLSKHHPARVVGRVEEGETGVEVPGQSVKFTGAKF